MVEIIFCERKKLKVKDFALLVANSDEKIYALSQKFQKYKDEITGKKIFCGALVVGGVGRRREVEWGRRRWREEEVEGGGGAPRWRPPLR